MAALVFAPPPWQFFAFPLVVHWQAQYDALSFYFPDLHFGLLADKPDQGGFTTVLQPPRQQGLQALEPALSSRGVEPMAGLSQFFGHPGVS